MSFLLSNVGKDARIVYGSRKEFQFSLLEKNYSLSNEDLGAIIGCTSFHVSRLKKQWRESGRMAKFVLEEFMRLHGSDTVPDAEKYQVISKMLSKLIDLGLVLPTKGATSVEVRIFDDVRPLTANQLVPVMGREGDEKDAGEEEATV